MPMRGKTDEQVQYEMLRLTILLEGPGYEVADSLVTDMDGALNLPLLCLSKSIAVMSGCDVAFFADGLEHDKVQLRWHPSSMVSVRPGIS